MMYQWDRIVGQIVWARARAARIFGLPPEELMAVGRAAAVEAEQSWQSSGGRSMSSWVYLSVQIAVQRAMVAAGRYAAEEEEVGVDPEPEAQYFIREALEYLEARLPSEDWVLLWLYHAEGRNCVELAERWGIAHQSMRRKISKARKKAATLCALYA